MALAAAMNALLAASHHIWMETNIIPHQTVLVLIRIFEVPVLNANDCLGILCSSLVGKLLIGVLELLGVPCLLQNLESWVEVLSHGHDLN